MDPALQALALQLAEAAIRNTASSIADRLTVLRTKKQDKETISELEQIINDLIADKNELLRIAQAFEAELVAQKLSNGDVEYITSNVLPVIQKLVEMSSGEQAEAAEQVIDAIGPILSKETATVLQLLGFNFRKAIGEPLTELVSRSILSKAPSGDSDDELARLNVKREIAMAEVVKDPEANERLKKWWGRAD